MCEILEHVDFEAMGKAEPKWFMGYSDNTNMTFLLNTLCDTAAIYGPCAAAFGMEPWHMAISDAFGLLQGKKTEFANYPLWEKESKKDEEHPLEPYFVTEPFCVRRFPDKDSVMAGRMLGGCLDCLGRLVGTKYDKVKDFIEKYKQDGIVWFLEVFEMSTPQIYINLWKMKNAGYFENCKGIIFGRPLMVRKDYEISYEQTLKDALSSLDIPVIYDADIGHVSPQLPIVSGGILEVECENGKGKIKNYFE